jgi:hypothetical protein
LTRSPAGRIRSCDVRELASRHRNGLVWLGLAALALAVYLPYALKAGWYYDDWANYTDFESAGGSWSAQFDACTAFFPAGRKVPCLYHVTVFHLLGSHRAAYHLLAIFFLVVMAGLTYTILKRCRLPWQWAALVAILLIVFPSCDTARLWPTGAVGQYVIVLELTGVLLALKALDLQRTRPVPAGALHAAAAVLFLLAMASYEIAIPLVALNGLVYWVARKDRAALKRGGADLLFAFAFVVYRLVIDPADPNEGFTVHRTMAENLDRAWKLTSAAWGTWHETFLPGALGTLGALAVLALTVVLFTRERRMRRRFLPWIVLFGNSLILALAATFVYLTSNDLYVPQLGSTYNRMILPASIAYVGIFVGLVGAGYEIVRRFVPLRFAGIAAVGAMVLASGFHQLRISSDHKRAWEASWNEQELALEGYAQAVRNLPEESRLIGFGAPIWESGFIPIFASDWDLRNAIAYTTSFQPAAAQPMFPGITCGRRGLRENDILLIPYRMSGKPLYFISSTRRSARPVRSQIQCRRAIAAWGRPPFFALTVNS